MDDRVFIVVGLVIALCLLAGLYFVLDLSNHRVLGFVVDARAREQREIVNHERLARTLNQLVDEVTVLADALKNERILRSHAEAAGCVAEKKAARATPMAPTVPDASDAGGKQRTDEASAAAAKISVPEPSDDAETRVLSRADLQASPRPVVRLTPTRISAPSAPRGESP